MIEVLGSKSSEKPCNTIDTLIGVKTDIKGDITFSGGLRIDGKIVGNITSQNDSRSTLILSEHAEVTGNVRVPHMIVNGRIKGNVHSVGRIELQQNAEIEGDLRYKVIEMALGASINGNLIREDAKAGDERKGTIAQLKSANSGQDVTPDN